MKNLKLKDPAAQVEKIVNFLGQTYQEQGKDQAVIAVSGGIDSSLALALLTQALGVEKIRPLMLPYGKQNTVDAELALNFNQIPEENWRQINIKLAVDAAAAELEVAESEVGETERVRLGNIMARVRMMMIYDVAKEMGGLVCGTENKSEKYLGYFTRFGDEASDLEPLVHLYKTQVWQLARFLELPEKIINQPPSAGLWDGQTDEEELGFSYEVVDQVLWQLVEEGREPDEIEIEGVSAIQVEAVVERVERMEFKHRVPYKICTVRNRTTSSSTRK